MSRKTTSTTSIFFCSRARRIGYVVFVKEEEQEKGAWSKPRRLYFGPSDANHPGLRPVTFRAQVGHLADRLQTDADHRQSGQERHRPRLESIDQATNHRQASLDDPKFGLNRDLIKLLESAMRARSASSISRFSPRKRPTSWRAAILLERSKDLVKASGTCVGLPDLRAGQRVRIAGLGARFSGEYFITDTTHTINDSGYITKFNGRREEPGK